MPVVRNPNPTPPPKNKTRKKIWIAALLVILLIGIAAVLQAREYYKWARLAEFGRDAGQELKMDEVSDSAIQEYERQAAQKNAGANVPAVATKPTTSAKPKAAQPAPAPEPSVDLQCADLSFLPPAVADYRYACKGIYDSDPGVLAAAVAASGAERLILIGAYVYINCPASILKKKDVVTRCYNAAKFADSIQIPKMREITGIAAKGKKIHIYYADSLPQVAQLCNHPTASACMQTINGRDTIYNNALSSGTPFYNAGVPVQASVYRGLDHEIAYNFTMTIKSDCYAAFTHEIIHSLQGQDDALAKTMYSWIDEFLAFELTPFMVKEFCPPGTVFTNVVKTEDGQQTPVPNFDLSKLDLEDPMSSSSENYAEGRQCRRAIFNQMAGQLNQKGVLFIKLFYSQLEQTSPYDDMGFARALWAAAGSPIDMRDYFRAHGCT